MEKKITQFRYYGDGSKYNYPGTLQKTRLESGSAFDDYTPIIQLGIQSLPGTKFYINANIDGVIVGASGIYELDLTNTSGQITKLTFDPATLETVNQCQDGYLVVDIMYQEE